MIGNKPLGNLSVLLVEDDPLSRDVLKDFLENSVEHYYDAGNGAEGLEVFKAFHPNIVVTDIMMPQMDGLEMMHEIKKIDPGVHFILVTALEDMQFIFQAVEMGIQRYLLKPIQVEKLKTTLLDISRNIWSENQAYLATMEAIEYKMAVDQCTIVTRTDSRGFMTYANENFCNVTGYSLEELLGKKHNIVRHPSMSDKLFAELWETISQKKIWRGRITNRTKEGGYCILETTITPIVGENGEVKEYLAIQTDSTQFVTLGRRIKQQEKEQIEKEREYLEQLNRTKDSMLMLFSHELKTPLNAVMNFSEILKKRIGEIPFENKGEIITYLDVIHENGTSMLEHVSNLLELYQLKSGKTKINNQEVNLIKLLAKLKSHHEEAIRQRKIDVQIVTESDCTVCTDENRLMQICNNLFSNAMKYGLGKIRITLRKKRNQFLIAFEDNGKGFDNPDAMCELFEQGDEDMLRRRSQGLGIGLHFVKLLSEHCRFELRFDKSEALGGAKVGIIGTIAEEG